MKPALFFLFVLLIPLASAFDCDNIMYSDACDEILMSDIRDSEKIYLLEEVFSDSKYFANHEFVYS